MLQKARFVFVRRDARKAPLQTPYDGPFEVVERSNKHFTLRLGNQLDKVSIDRLKPAYVDRSHPTDVAKPPRRGRPPTPPLTQTHPDLHRTQKSQRVVDTQRYLNES